MKGGVVLCGVGGMGILKSSEIIASVVVRRGFDVRQSEVHGMAQRGGSVVTHLRYGEEVHSPLLLRGEAEHMIAFEELEALRYAPYLRRGALIILNTFRMCPPGVDPSQYPENVPKILEGAGFEVIPVSATDIAIALGDVRVTNSVLLGAFSRFFFIEETGVWEEALKEAFQDKALDLNLSAFYEGRKW